jgi:hypothetical protein
MARAAEGDAMKLWFRLPEDDREDELDEAPSPPKLPSPEKARGAALIGVGVIVACQILLPVALPFLLMFGTTGAAAGALLALQDREAAAVGVVGLWFIEEVFVRPSGDPGWAVGTTIVSAGAVALGWGVGLLVRRAWEGRHGG